MKRNFSNSVLLPNLQQTYVDNVSLGFTVKKYPDPRSDTVCLDYSLFCLTITI